MTYHLSFTVSTEADQSALLDALIDFAESFADDFESMHDQAIQVDEESPCVASED